jgi:hypothetical protein
LVQSRLVEDLNACGPELDGGSGKKNDPEVAARDGDVIVRRRDEPVCYRKALLIAMGRCQLFINRKATSSARNILSQHINSMTQ